MIIIGAGDMSSTANGAAGRASSPPQSVRLFAPTLIKRIAAAASTIPVQSMLTPAGVGRTSSLPAST
ncbi:MAG: hypothetical protein LOD94_03050 [Gammaproteobacteria bacterium]